MFRDRVITREIQQHDSKLYCKRNENNILCIYRKSVREELYEVDGYTLINIRPAPHFCFALTKDWTLRTEPADWGIVPILEKLKASDLWTNETMVDKLLESYDKDKESSERQMDNNNEAFLKEFRKDFAKTFDGVNTANMKKIDVRSKREK